MFSLAASKGFAILRLVKRKLRHATSTLEQTLARSYIKTPWHVYSSLILAKIESCLGVALQLAVVLLLERATAYMNFLVTTQCVRSGHKLSSVFETSGMDLQLAQYSALSISNLNASYRKAFVTVIPWEFQLRSGLNLVPSPQFLLGQPTVRAASLALHARGPRLKSASDRL